MSNDYYRRQNGIVPREYIPTITIAGCGAVGKQIGTILSASGLDMGGVHLWDFDTIEDVNIGSQGWCPKDIGRLKVDVLKRTMLELNPDGVIHAYNRRYGIGHEPSQFFFMCVDSVEARREIGRRIQDRFTTDPIIIIDTRQSPEGCRVVCYDNFDKWWATIPETNDNNGCSVPSTLYQSYITAAIAVHRMVRYLRKESADCDILVELQDPNDMFTNLMPRT